VVGGVEGLEEGWEGAAGVEDEEGDKRKGFGLTSDVGKRGREGGPRGEGKNIAPC
jgi:hypothetical protein